MSVIRHNQPLLTRVFPHNGNARFVIGRPRRRSNVEPPAPVLVPVFGPFIDAASRARYWLRGTPEGFEVGFSLDDDATDPEIWVPFSDRPEGLSKAAWRRIGANAGEVLQ